MSDTASSGPGATFRAPVEPVEYLRTGETVLWTVEGTEVPMSEPREHGAEPVEETREEILASAPRFPPLQEMVIEDLTEEEERVFLETIQDA